jgi:hypothetical protein
VAATRQIVRVFIAASIALAAWVTSSSAWAAPAHGAPYCDDRGASALAPPPTFEASDVAIRRARLAGCGSDARSLFASISSARRAASFAGHSLMAGLPSTASWVIAVSSEPLAATDIEGADRRGVRFRIDRPPIT